jgi:hypothetical protein
MQLDGRVQSFSARVVGDPDMELERAIVARLLPLELRAEKVLSVLVYSRSQWDSKLYRAMPFHRNVTREGLEI